MQNVNTRNRVKKPRPNLLEIKAQTSLKQTFKLIKSNKQIDIVWVKKPKPSQMSAVLAHKLLGRKFHWIQSFENPPVPSLWEKLLVAQADRIIVTTRRDYNKLKRFGVNITKIRIEK